MKRLSNTGIGIDSSFGNRNVSLNADAHTQPASTPTTRTSTISATQHHTQVMTSKPLKEAWPETRTKMIEVAQELRKRAEHWETYKYDEKPHYRNIVTPESKRNRAAMLERSIALMDDYMAKHPEAANDCIEVHHSDPDAGQFLMQRIATTPPANVLQEFSRGGYLIYAGNDRKRSDGPEPGECIVVASAPEGGGGALKVISPCWGQEEQAFMQIPMLHIAIYGEGFTTRYNNPSEGNLMEITPVLVNNVVPLATLGTGATSTRKPEPRNGRAPDYSTSVFHASGEQFDPKATLPAKEGAKIKALFYSFIDMRKRLESGDIEYRLDDLKDMAISVGKAAKLYSDSTPPKQQLHGIGVGTGIYEHAECVSAAMTIMMLALQGRGARLYYGEAAFMAARDMVLKVFDAMARKDSPREGFLIDDYVQELFTQINAVVQDENNDNRVHWRIGGFKKGREDNPPRSQASHRTADPSVQQVVNADNASKGATENPQEVDLNTAVKV
ncbi:MAG: hypothetical protein ACO1OR_01660 [Hydrogenophaga sp.]|uniref:hypothetical protein n=1 Tax=Hydrogenophaga intermedia TaxID=65786 RepID=UPI002044BD0A|nr:hypothetical protein [Hydrogenophaga intermedia]MCM3565224.1 hypothetical protein [Hydrogenophaga intermedia]